MVKYFETTHFWQVDVIAVYFLTPTPFCRSSHCGGSSLCGRYGYRCNWSNSWNVPTNEVLHSQSWALHWDEWQLNDNYLIMEMLHIWDMMSQSFNQWQHRKCRSGEMYWLTFLWPWAKVTAVALINKNFLVCTIKWEPLFPLLQKFVAVSPY